MIKKFSLFISCSLALMANEPSAFGAGDMNSPNPYGLTSTEKHIYENKKLLTTQQDNLNQLKSETRSTSTRLDDMQSEIEGLKGLLNSEGQKGNSQVKDISRLKDDAEKNSLAIKTIEKQIDDLKVRQEKFEKETTENIENLKNIMKEMSVMITKLQEDGGAASKASNKNDKNDKSDKKDVKEEPKKAQTKDKESAIDLNKDSKELMSDGEEAYQNGETDKAKKIFEKLVEAKYKPARSTFVLGEIEYNKKNYSKALDYYKKSVSAYDKAEHMPDLLYHSGVSCFNLKDNKNAVMFLTTMLDTYPEHKDADKAKKLLNSLKNK